MEGRDREGEGEREREKWFVDTSDRNHKCHPVGTPRIPSRGNPSVASTPLSGIVTRHLFFFLFFFIISSPA